MPHIHCKDKGHEKIIDKMFCLDYSAVCVMRKRLSAALKQDRKLSVQVERLKK